MDVDPYISKIQYISIKDPPFPSIHFFLSSAITWQSLDY